jgi:anti-sigma B factor antagonist
MPEETSPAVEEVKEEPRLSFAVETKHGATVIRCKGKLTAGYTELLHAEVKPHLARAQRVVLDLTNLTYMDSMGLGAIASLYVSARTAGCRLELVNLSKRIRELFSITNMLSLFEVCGDNSIRIP